MTTVRLCHDSAGWFAALDAQVPSELVRYSATFANRRAAVSAVRVVSAIARALNRFGEQDGIERAIARMPLYG